MCLVTHSGKYEPPHMCLVTHSGKYEPPHDKTNNVVVRPAKTQISLGICPVWSESSLSAWRKPGSLPTHWAHSEDSDQTGWMPRLIWVFAGRTCYFVGFEMRWLIFFNFVVLIGLENVIMITKCVLSMSVIIFPIISRAYCPTLWCWLG